MIAILRRLWHRFLNLPVLTAMLAFGGLMFVSFASAGIFIGVVPVLQVIGVAVVVGILAAFSLLVAIIMAAEYW